jgi:hypothetical protein
VWYPLRFLVQAGGIQPFTGLLDANPGAAFAIATQALTREHYIGNLPIFNVRRTSDSEQADVYADRNADGFISLNSHIVVTNGSSSALTLGEFANEEVVTYESDFSAGIDGWGATGGPTLSAIDDELNVVCPPSVGSGPTRAAYTVGQITRVRAKLRRVSGSNPILIGFRTAAVWSYDLINKSGNLTDMAGNNGLRVSLADNTEQVIEFTIRHNSGSTSNSLWVQGVFNSLESTFRLYDVEITQVASNCTTPIVYDQSGNNRHATQGTTGAQPTIVSGGALVTENGRPALSFDGVDDYFTAPRNGFNPGSQIYTAIVLKPNTGTLKGVIGQYDAPETKRSWWINLRAENTMQAQYSSTGATGAASFSFLNFGSFTSVNQLLSYQFRTTAATADNRILSWRNTQALGLVNRTNDVNDNMFNADTPFIVGAIDPASPSQFYSGTISSALVFSGDRQDIRLALESAIAAANGIPAT